MLTHMSLMFCSFCPVFGLFLSCKFWIISFNISAYSLISFCLKSLIYKSCPAYCSYYLFLIFRRSLWDSSFTTFMHWRNVNSLQCSCSESPIGQGALGCCLWVKQEFDTISYHGSWDLDLQFFFFIMFIFSIYHLEYFKIYL